MLPTDIRSLSVTGSTSGGHLGHLTQLPDQAGTAFVPSQPFAPGEQVSVVATMSSQAAATASGSPTSTTLAFSFTIGVAAPGPPDRKPPGYGGTQKFHSAPRLHPPLVFASPNPDSASGDILLTPEFAPQDGPMILDSQGRLIWFRPVGDLATNLEVQSYRGQPVLTWWQRSGSHSPPQDVIVNTSYRTVARVHAAEGYAADVHEFQLTPQGTALIDAYVPVKAHLSSIGGPSSASIMDCVIQEVDVRTSRVLWEWHALGHVSPAASYMGTPTPTTPYDFFHLNSIQQLPNGNLIISARHTWAIYEIDRQTGNIIWTLGGKHSSFKTGAGANFEWQHDARLHPRGILSLFDDAATPPEEHQSSAKVLRLNTANMTASLLRRYTHFPPVLSESAGNTQVLLNGDVFVGWGQQPEFSEYAGSGRQIWNGSFPNGVRSYRAYRFPWYGQPLTKPSLAVSPQGAGLVVYASWNGATQVASWRILAGPAPNALSPAGRTSRTGFETSMTLHNQPRYVAVQALGARGTVLGTSTAQAG